MDNQGAPDGARYCGRTFVQLTGKSNYKTFGPRLTSAVDLVAHPELDNNTEIAAELLALLLQAHEIGIKTALLRRGFATASEFVNGGSHGLEDFRSAYEIGEALVPSLI